MYTKKNILILTLIGIILGFLIIRQLYLTKQAEKIKTGEDNQMLALEISQLIKANSDLRLEMTNLSTTQEKYNKSLEDKKGASEELSKNLEKYKIISGVTKIAGQGVEIKIEGGIEQEQLVDLVNALRNIGVDGVSINSKRFIISSYFTKTAEGIYLGGTKISAPYVVGVVGNGALVKESLLRRGGIIDQIKESGDDIKVDVEQKEEITLPAS